MLASILLYLGAASVAIWGAMHLVKTKPVVAGFEPLTADNRHGLRMEWIVDTYLKKVYEARFFPGAQGGGTAGFDDVLLPHVYYTVAGAASVIFANAPECERLTGMDPTTDEAIERHAEFLARLLVP